MARSRQSPCRFSARAAPCSCSCAEVTGTGVAAWRGVRWHTHSREEVTWLTTSVTAATNSRAAIRIETASDRETVNPVAAAVWSPPTAAVGVAETTTRSSRNRLASTRAAGGRCRRPRRHCDACVPDVAVNQKSLRKRTCKLCKRRERPSRASCRELHKSSEKLGQAASRSRHWSAAWLRGMEFAFFYRYRGPLKSIPVLNQRTKTRADMRIYDIEFDIDSFLDEMEEMQRARRQRQQQVHRGADRVGLIEASDSDAD